METFENICIVYYILEFVLNSVVNVIGKSC